MKLPIPIGVDSPLGRRIVGLSFFRLAVLASFVGLIQIYFELELGGFSSTVAIGTAALAFLTTAVYALPLRRERWLQAMAHVQLITDQLTWTAIVYISGGVTSGSTSLYGLTCLSGAILLGTYGALSAAAAGTTFYLALCLGFAQGWIRPPSDQAFHAYLTRASDMIYPAFSAVLAMIVVTLLASYLAERLRFFGGRLEDATRRAVEAERLAALGRLAAGLAHEIRNPLGSIRGSIELLRTGRALNDEDKHLCRIIEQETARLNQLVTDMIDLSRPREPTLHEIDLANVVASVVELAKTSARGADVTVRYQGPPTLVIIADRGQMHQVLWNLVRNAMQVSAAGSEIVVELAKTEDGSAALSVRDAGPGVTESEREKLFDAFFTTRKHGVGIGLAVVKQIVEGHGFRIDVNSEVGQGTTFAVRVPKAMVVALLVALLPGCGGSEWVRSQPPSGMRLEPNGEWREAVATASVSASGAPPPAPTHYEAPAPLPPLPVSISGSGSGSASGSVEELYRNTYYYFPEEPNYPETGPTRQLFDAECKALRTVSQDFHDKLCVQGSGRLATGDTVSFAKRGCECAAECPRTGHKICYELLDRVAFPYGRGANGKAITPLRTVAVDSDAIALGRVLYIPEMNGLRDMTGKPHDGCFIAEDRGSKVKGKHVDIFAGTSETAAAWNVAVPSNRGVHVIVDASQCRFLAPVAAAGKDNGARRPPSRKKR
jgi:signal transduction histidine kinase/3D (Asp-Asp-Asp) domain-containing protein